MKNLIKNAFIGLLLSSAFHATSFADYVMEYDSNALGLANTLANSCPDVFLEVMTPLDPNAFREIKSGEHMEGEFGSTTTLEIFEVFEVPAPKNKAARMMIHKSWKRRSVETKCEVEYYFQGKKCPKSIDCKQKIIWPNHIHDRIKINDVLCFLSPDMAQKACPKTRFNR